MNFLVGLILIASGILVVRYRFMLYNFTGDWAWAQKFLGSNGTLVAITFFGFYEILKIFRKFAK